MSAAVLDAKMTLENSGFVKNMDRAREAGASALETFKAITLGVTGLGGAFAALRGVDAFADGIKGAFEQGRQLAVLSRQTSQSVKDLVQLRQAFAEAGLSSDEVGRSIFMLQKALGGVNEEGLPTSDAFNRIGVSIAQLKGMSAVQQFQAITEGLHRLPDVASRSAVAMQIFGRSALDVQGLLNDPKGFEEAVRNSEVYAKSMQRNAAAFEQVEKTVEQVQFKVRDFYAGIAAGVAPGLQVVLDSLNKIDLAGLGTKIGNALSLIFEAFKEGKLSELVSLELTAGFKEAVNNFVGLIQAAEGAIQQSLGVIFSQDFFKSAAKGFKGVAETFAGALVDALQEPLNMIQSAISYLFDKRDAQKNILPAAKNAGAYDKIAEQHFKIANAIQKTNPEGAKREYALAHEATDKAGAAWADAKRYKDLSTMSLSDYIASNANRPATFYGKTSDDWSVKGGDDILAAAPKIQQGLNALSQIFTDAAKNWKSANIFSGDEKAKANAILAGLMAKVNGLANSALTNVQQNALQNPIGSATYKLPEGDRLAKVGLFIGGSPASPGISEARRTAAATEATSRGVEHLVNVFRGRPGQTAGLYN